MNLFERLILRRLMNATIEGGKVVALPLPQVLILPPSSRTAMRPSNKTFKSVRSATAGERDSSNSSKPPNSSRRLPRRSSKNFQKIATKKAGRNFTRSWGARKKLKTTVLSHRKAAMGHFKYGLELDA